MQKPKNYDTVTGYGEFEPLELGGHICKIMKVEETKSSTGKDMLKISIDIAEGRQKDYYAKQYKADTRNPKKWGCIVYQLVEDSDGNTNRGLKTFIESVAKSNAGFNPDEIWNDKFGEYFKGKLIGGVFGREQFKTQDGKLKWSTKCINFRDVETIKKGVPVPEDKYLSGEQKSGGDTNFAASFAPIDEDDLPF